MAKEASERFFAKTVRIPFSGCWLWTASVNKDGYGRFKPYAAFPMGAHRFSWMFHHGEIPENMKICHHCDIPSCVNPEHLFLGTQLENVQDMDAKGRRTTAFGSKSGTAKINELTARKVKDMRSAGIKMNDIAKSLEIPPTTVQQISRGRTWRHV